MDRPLADPLQRLATQDIFLGTSSWKYPGWLGSVYTPERYLHRGKFSKSAFEKNCLNEFAETFPTVCGDFLFYQFPTQPMIDQLFSQVPQGFHFAFKVPEDITVKRFPSHPRYGDKGGINNPFFLNAEVFLDGYLEPLKKYRYQITLIFEFGAFHEIDMPDATTFVRHLDKFLNELPEGFRFSVEIRNEEFLVDEYLACLKEHGVSHVLNAWSRMPSIEEQIQIPGILTADFIVFRGLLRKGRLYAEAVSKFSPYETLQEENKETRKAMRQLISHARQNEMPLFGYLNNRFEGFAPGTIEALIAPE